MLDLEVLTLDGVNGTERLKSVTMSNHWLITIQMIIMVNDKMLSIPTYPLVLKLKINHQNKPCLHK
jgi:hypothetical protein